MKINENEVDPMWVTANEDGTIKLWWLEPERTRYGVWAMGCEDYEEVDEDKNCIPLYNSIWHTPSPFPDLKWEDEPLEVRLSFTIVEKGDK